MLLDQLNALLSSSTLANLTLYEIGGCVLGQVCRETNIQCPDLDHP